ncbi:MAG: ribosome maturation factor RimP [Epulopiscium sp.]|jgi:ribosome maturation factor RimP|nr:ribosome maturation factor RimP [Candidatus Epulonipiscium sp.]
MIKGNQTEKKVTELLLPILEKENFELVDVEFVKEGPNWYLRIYVDKEGGISIDDCETVSRALDKKMDDASFIEQAYILEVSSPGIDRPLKKPEDFVKYAGEVVDVKLYKARDREKEFQGILKGLVDGVITLLDEDGKEMNFEQKEVASIRLAVIF